MSNTAIDILYSASGTWYVQTPNECVVLTEDENEALNVAHELGYSNISYETTPFKFSDKKDADAFIKRVTHPTGMWIVPFLSASYDRGAYVVGIDGYFLS